MNSIPILYENEQILVINKPSGLAVQGGNGVSRSLDKEFSQQVGYKIYLVHRLDKDTSGLMIVAKNPVAAGEWTRLVASKQVKKEYLAVCAGRLDKKNGVITEKIVQHGKTVDAKTFYTVEDEWSAVCDGEEIPLCLVRLCLDSGRMHQIRIHLAKKNCPVLGDELHGNFKLNKKLRNALGVKSLQLCSAKITLPIDGKLCVFEIEYSPNYR